MRIEVATEAMRAIIHDRYGSPDLLHIGEADVPTVADDQVLVRVRASSVNAGDWRRVRANPILVRFVEGFRRPKSPLLGGDVAGVVERVGASVTDLHPGDEVYGIRSGAFAEFVAGRNLVRKPVNLTLEQAAAVPIAGVTALQAVRDHGRVLPGNRVLVNGAGGGVGSFAVQIAKADGADVTAVTRTENVEMLGELGADHVIDYTREDFTRTAKRYDVVIDPGGNRSVRELRRVLDPGGRLVLVGAGRGPGGPVGRLLGGMIRKRVLRQTIAVFIASVRKGDLVALRELIEAGKVRPAIDRTYPLEQVGEALKYVEAGGVRGKVVIIV